MFHIIILKVNLIGSYILRINVAKTFFPLSDYEYGYVVMYYVVY